MKYLLLLCFTLFVYIKSFTQDAIGEWHEYLSFSNVLNIEKVNNTIYAATDFGIFTYDTEEYNIQKYTKINGLNDADIATIKRIPNSNKIFIGYENGNIDIFENGNIDNIPDLKIKSLTISKRINHIDFFNDLAYCATDFGILVVDYNKLEISDFYYIGNDATSVVVNQIAHTSDSIYAATESGLRKAPINSSSLSFYETWEYTSDYTAQFSGVISVNNEIITTKLNNSSYETFHYANGNWNKIHSSSNFVKLEAFNNDFAIVLQNKIELFYNNLIPFQTISEYQIEDTKIDMQCNCVLIDDNEEIWIGDSENGMIKVDESYDLQILPDGPGTNASTKLLYTNNNLYSINGLPHQRTPLSTPAICSILTLDGWKILNKNNEPYFSFTYNNGTTNYNINTINLSDIAVDPTNKNRLYISSARHGIYELLNNEIINHYYIDNSGLQVVFDGSNPYASDWVLINSLVVDNSGNLYACNQEVSYPIVIKPYNVSDDKSEWIQYDYLPYDDPEEQAWLQNLIFTSWGDIWAITSTDPDGLFMTDINDTPYDSSDDTYRGPKNPRNITFNDSRYSDVNVLDEDGETISSKLLCMIEDKNGYIWIGTEEGPIVYYRPQDIFEEENPYASKILVPRNDGTGLADYLLDNEKISAIAIDGANRKWFGTQNGVYLVSEDGTETINHFTTDNSPLISNMINSISINPENGEVFIATNKGIVSYIGTATEGKESYNSVTAFPNPVKPGYEGVITIRGLIENSTTIITDISGKLVYKTTSDGGQVVWNGRNLNNKKVSSGVYLVFATNEEGEKSLATKIMIVR